MDIGACSLWEGISIGEGGKGDYAGLARWHYRAGMPVAVTRVLVAKFRVSGFEFQEHSKLDTGNLKLAGVLVETRPVLNCRLRNEALPGRYVGGDKRRLARRLNREVTTIARVVVVPRFRGIGVAEALVRRALATARTPYVEALSSMGRQQRFFEHAGMRRFDRPMPADSVRLLAALAHEGLVAADLCGLRGHEVSGFLARELVRFSRAGRRHHEDTKGAKTHEEDGRGRQGDTETTGEKLKMENRKEKKGIRGALEEARRRVLSWPAYYVWRRDGARVPAVAAAGDVGEMAEAFTVFMSSREKRGLMEALRGTHPDAGRALLMWAGGRHHEDTKGAKTHEDISPRRHGDTEEEVTVMGNG